MAGEFGDCFTLRLVTHGSVVVVSEPRAIREVFSGELDAYRAGDTQAFLKPLVGDASLLLLDGERHRRQRRLVLNALAAPGFEHYRGLVEEVVDEGVRSWPRDTAFPLRPRLQAITAEVQRRALLGGDDGPEAALLKRRLRRLAKGSLLLIPLLRIEARVPALSRSVFRVARRGVDRTILAEIARRRNGAVLDDVLGRLVAAPDHDGGAMTDAELRDNAVTLLLTGHDVTASALAWCFDAMLHEPRVLARVEAELEAGEETFLDAVIAETLRVRPPVPVVNRELARPMAVAGHHLPEGTKVWLCPYLAHRRRDSYPGPDRFRPERFLERPPPAAPWFPFGGGTRRCVGGGLAMVEMKAVIARIVRSVRLRAAEPDHDPPKRRFFFLVPGRGVPVKVEE
jgi:cytochrome P450